MKSIFACIIFASSLLSPPALAKDLPKGARPVSDAEQIKLFSGKKFTGPYYGKDGKKAGTFTAHFRNGGAKAVTVTSSGGKKTSKTLKWYVKSGKFCEQLFSSEKVQCGTQGVIFKAGGTCYTTESNRKTVRNEFRC